MPVGLKAFCLGVFWFMSTSLNGQELKFDIWTKHLNIEGERFFKLAEDCQGNIWIGTVSNGIFVTDGYTIQHFKKEKDLDNSLIGNDIKSLAVDSDCKIWVGTSDGLSIYDQKNNIYKNIRFTLNPELALPDHLINNFVEDHNGDFWIGSRRGITHIQNDGSIVENLIIVEEKNRTHTQTNFVNILIEDRSNKDIFWIGTNYGLVKFTKSTKQFIHQPVPGHWHHLRPRLTEWVIRSIIQTDDNTLYLGAIWTGGIFRYQINEDRWTRYQSFEYPEFGDFKGNSIYELFEYNADSLFYISDLGNGYFNKNSGKFNTKFLQRREESSLAYVNYDMEIDQRGHLWIVSQYDVHKSIVPFLSNRAVSEQAPYILQVEIMGVKYPVSNNYVLPSDSNNINITLACTNPSSLDSVYFRWRMDHDNQWTIKQGSNKILLQDLDHRCKIFEFSFRNSTNDPWVDGSPIYFSIEKPIYLKVWFLGLMFGIFLVLLVGISQFRIYRIKQKEKIKTQLAEIKMSSLRSQMNPHFLFNSLNSINHFILKNNSDKASYYLTKFSRLMRQVLRNSRQANISLKDELEVINLYIEMEQLRFDHTFKYQLNIDPEISPEELIIPPLLIQPYVENAIWHGIMPLNSPGQLTIDIAMKDKLIIRVIDNGIGREASQKSKNEYSSKKSFGLKITDERLSLINLLYQQSTQVNIIDHNDDLGNPSGTEVVLTIPLKQSH